MEKSSCISKNPYCYICDPNIIRFGCQQEVVFIVCNLLIIAIEFRNLSAFRVLAIPGFLILGDGWAKAMARMCISKSHPMLGSLLHNAELEFPAHNGYIQNMPYLDIYAAAVVGSTPEAPFSHSSTM